MKAFISKPKKLNIRKAKGLKNSSSKKKLHNCFGFSKIGLKPR